MWLNYNIMLSYKIWFYGYQGRKVVNKKGHACQESNLGSFLAQRLNYKREGVIPLKLNTIRKFKTPKTFKMDSTIERKGKTKTQTYLNRDIKCFKCLRNRHIVSQHPNKQIMIMKVQGEIEFNSDKSEEDEMYHLRIVVKLSI